MDKYEEYKPGIVGRLRAHGIEYRTASRQDADSIARICVEREGGEVSTRADELRAEFEREKRAEGHAIWGAFDGVGLIGFGRVRKVVWTESTRDYPSPEGWYLLGLIVDRRYRRMGVGSGLSEARFEWLRTRGAPEVYSLVSSENRTSIDFHLSLGFEVVATGPGFLSIGFDCGRGYLMRKRL